jgi:hypothetical protein
MRKIDIDAFTAREKKTLAAALKFEMERCEEELKGDNRMSAKTRLAKHNTIHDCVVLLTALCVKEG